MADFFAQPIAILAGRLADEFGVAVRLCGEIECVVEGDFFASAANDFWQRINDEAAAQSVALESIGKEQTGDMPIQQFECRFRAGEPALAAQHVAWLKNTAMDLAREQNISLSFTPFHASSGVCSGLHWHLHLVDSDENYLFVKHEDQLSAPLACSLGGLLAMMDYLMVCFAQSDAAFARLQSGADHVPQTISWGGNNRTAALRLPESVIPLRHIEHRVCGADADPFASVWALLVGLHYGFAHACVPGEQTHGNANATGVPVGRLAMTRDTAVQALTNSRVLDAYIDTQAILAYTLR